MNDRVIPILRLAVLCERIEVDAAGRPYFCVPIHSVQLSPEVKGRFRPPTPHVYLQLQEALGQFNLTVVLRPERENIDLYRSPPIPVPFDGRNYQNVPVEIDLTLDQFEVPGPGHYELWVYANYVNLHNPDQQPGWPFPPMRLTVLGSDGSTGGVA